jgi:ABC-type Na+ transport system ATPase subunit NatA
MMSIVQVHLRALSLKQEKNLVDYLDERFLNLTRGYKKRLVYFKSLLRTPFE